MIGGDCGLSGVSLPRQEQKVHRRSATLTSCGYNTQPIDAHVSADIPRCNGIISGDREMRRAGVVGSGLVGWTELLVGWLGLVVDG